MSKIESLKIKKELYVQLSFSLYGTLVAYNTEGQVLVKSAAFAVSPEGKMFLIIHQPEEIQNIDPSRNVVFSVIKEGSSVSNMFEIKFNGKLQMVGEEGAEKKEAQTLFEKKSPYLSTVPFMSSESANFTIAIVKPSKIYYQSIQDAREGKPHYLLS